MAKAKAKSADKTIDVWKKKRWHRILAPKLFNEMVLGETPALDPNTIVGRRVTTNMTTLTGEIKKQNISVTFEVNKVMGDTAYTGMKRMEMSPAALRRLVRRGKKRVDDSFLCKTSDGKRVWMKPFMITFSNTTNSVLTNLRKHAKAHIIRSVRGMAYETLCKELVSNNLQRNIKKPLSKIYPLRVFDIRVMELESEAENETAAEAAEEKGNKGEKEEKEEKKSGESSGTGKTPAKETSGTPAKDKPAGKPAEGSDAESKGPVQKSEAKNEAAGGKEEEKVSEPAGDEKEDAGSSKESSGDASGKGNAGSE
ncbi:MAG: hypothetical protein R6U32_03385 [Candidatus Woesearchaeota archaeon]